MILKMEIKLDKNRDKKLANQGSLQNSYKITEKEPTEIINKYYIIFSLYLYKISDILIRQFNINLDRLFIN